jgi:hypothetical protein
LEKKYNLKIGFSVYEEERDVYNQKSKIILNLHYYSDPALETCRINEVLNFDKLIISEFPSPKDSSNIELYKNVVVFVDEINKDMSNLEMLIEKINFYLIDDNYKSFIQKLPQQKMILEEKIQALQYENFNSLLS